MGICHRIQLTHSDYQMYEPLFEDSINLLLADCIVIQATGASGIISINGSCNSMCLHLSHGVTRV